MTLCYYTRSEDRTLVVVRHMQKLHIRVTIGLERHYYTIQEPLAAAQQKGSFTSEPKQVIVNSTDTAQDIFRKIDAQP